MCPLEAGENESPFLLSILYTRGWHFNNTGVFQINFSTKNSTNQNVPCYAKYCNTTFLNLIFISTVYKSLTNQIVFKTHKKESYFSLFFLGATFHKWRRLSLLTLSFLSLLCVVTLITTGVTALVDRLLVLIFWCFFFFFFLAALPPRGHSHCY